MPHGSPDFDRRSNDDSSSAAFEQRLHELLDSRVAPEDDAWMQSQAALADENQQLLSGQQLMLDGLELSEIPELPHNFAERCVALAVGEADSRPAPKHKIPSNGRFNWRFTALAASICVVLALIAAEPLRTWMQPLPGSSADSELPTDEPEDSALPDLGVAKLEDPVAPNEPGANEIGVEEPPSYDDLYELFRELRGRLPEQEPEWVGDIAMGLRPMADSMGGALNALRRNLPPTPKTESGDKPQAWLNHRDSDNVS